MVASSLCLSCVSTAISKKMNVLSSIDLPQVSGSFSPCSSTKCSKVETILITHRAAMMRHVDNIVVRNGGRIMEEGTHDFLVAKNSLYVRLMQPHFGKGLRQHRLV